MAHISRKFIDQHWSVFVAQGILAIVFGGLALFSSSVDFEYLIALVAVFLLALGIIELFNAINRHIRDRGWVPSVMIAVIDAVVAVALITTIKEPSTTWHMAVIAVYTLLRGIFEILIGLLSTQDNTDRFIRVLCGMCGAIMGFVLFNSSHLVIRFFGAYMLIFGICHLIYGVHNHTEKVDDHNARVEAAAKAKKTTKRPRSTKKK
ncbi:DUF308 domain-containing protein [Candidatus Saccharibacteria bacterium]|nr:DUF308 domain-containing protein [Candidatus Saccharibacteria bacterium]